MTDPDETAGHTTETANVPDDSGATACSYWAPDDCEGTPHCPPRCPRFVDKHGTPWTIREATESDRNGLREMYGTFTSAERAQGLPPVNDRQIETWLDRLFDRGLNVVAVGPDGIAGHAVYTPTYVADPELAVFVGPAYHGRGLGTELCKQIIALGAANGREAIELTVEPSNSVACGIYRRLGFEVVERKAREIEMRLPLSTATAIEVQHPPALRAK
ncbi:GNAT family N-acetyltransferase [Halopenitus sp. POP-27]|uniref:GNAT family N-acetyltransferase n=1 Tax=Halopenitus sp. POP-27 TaxID=2994425 RepID=UPI002468D7FA|nr:GNAT family N-acetyltransferase [Halopenitus sp. POP-27]